MFIEERNIYQVHRFYSSAAIFQKGMDRADEKAQSVRDAEQRPVTGSSTGREVFQNRERNIEMQTSTEYSSPLWHLVYLCDGEVAV